MYNFFYFKLKITYKNRLYFCPIVKFMESLTIQINID